MEWADALLRWLEAQPLGAILATMALLAAAENAFPPIPADMLVAFGGFLAARAGSSPWPAFLCVWGGNMLGAWGMYHLGRRFGADRIERRYRLDRTGRAHGRVQAWYARYGIGAFFLSRFVPGLRAVVPPMAGALRIPQLGVMIAMAAASGVWYGTVTWLAFRAGTSWDRLRSALGQVGLWSAVAALTIVGIVLLALLARRRHRGNAPRPPA